MNTRVLILGGSQKVIPLLDALKGIKRVSLVGVCDTERNSAGMEYARKLGLRTSVNLAEFVPGNNMDIIIETSGSKEFQKILAQIAEKGVRVMDSKTAELFIEVAREKEKAKRYGQLYLVDELSAIFSAECDTHNITRPVFDILKKSFQIEVEAILIFYEPKDELVVVSSREMKGHLKEQILDYLEKETASKIKKKIKKQDLDIFVQKVSSEPSSPANLRSFVSIPLLSKGKKEGMLVLASSQEDAFDSERVLILNILGDELALFIENERIKKALAESKNRLESMLQGMLEGVIVLDRSGGVILLNPAAKSFLGLKEIRLGEPLWQSLDSPEMIALAKDISKIRDLKTEEVKAFSDKGPVTLKLYIAPARDGLGAESGAIILITDITREKEVDRMKSEFISTTSHELRTPLAAIKESVMLILDGTTGKLNPQQDRFLGIAKRNIDRLTGYINDLLDLSKIETGKMQLRKEPCDMGLIIDKVLEPMIFLARDNKLELVKTVPANLPKVQCDAGRVSQVVVNLISNAIKFTPANGVITVKAQIVRSSELGVRSKEKVSEHQTHNSKLRDFVEISVTDTGIGISKKDIPKLFTRFGQLDGTLTRTPGGIGLGLAICKELIEMHGGRIWVESEPGKGSVFKFTLPVNSEQ